MFARLLLACCLFVLSGLAVQAEALSGKVSWVYDGDTLQVEKVGKVRLLGIDTPEHEASSRDDFYVRNFAIQADKLRNVAQQAKKFNIQQVKGKTVSLEYDRIVRDKHDRVLAYVYLPNGDMLNRLLLAEGLATVFRRYDFRYKKDFLATEKNARQKHLGLWGDAPVPWGY